MKKSLWFKDFISFPTDFLIRKSPQVHLHFERIPLSDIPQDQDQLRSWMFKRFQHKDT